MANNLVVCEHYHKVKKIYLTEKKIRSIEFHLLIFLSSKPHRKQYEDLYHFAHIESTIFVG